MAGGWKILTKIVPSTTAVRGPEALRKRNLLLDFPCKVRVTNMKQQ